MCFIGNSLWSVINVSRAWPRGQFNVPFQTCKQAEPELEPLKCKTGFIKLTHECVLCPGTPYRVCIGEEFKVHTPCDLYIMCFFFLRIKEHEMQMRIASACWYPCPKEAMISLSRPGLWISSILKKLYEPNRGWSVAWYWYRINIKNIQHQEMFFAKGGKKEAVFDLI